jgi:hypothetical protein
MTVDVCFSGNATRDKIGERGGERGMNREWKTKAQDRECQRGKRREDRNLLTQKQRRALDQKTVASKQTTSPLQ